MTAPARWQRPARMPEPSHRFMSDDALERLRLALANAPCPQAETPARMRALAEIAEVQAERGEARRAGLQSTDR